MAKILKLFITDYLNRNSDFNHLLLKKMRYEKNKTIIILIMLFDYSQRLQSIY